MRRIFTLVITMIMLFCILPFSSFSADGKNFCITLDANGGVIEGKSVYPINYGDYYSDVFGESLPVAVRDGYTLAGWLCEKYNYMLNVESSDYYAVYENTVFKAVWIDAEGDAPAENEKKYINEFEHIPNLLTYPILEKDEKGRPVDSPNNREVIRMVCKRFWDDVKN